VSAADILFLDTNIFLRYLTGDNPDQAARAFALLQRVEQGAQRATTTEAVLTEIVYVLASKRLYAVPRGTIRQRLHDLLDLRGLRLRDKTVYRRALDLYASTTLDFEDCIIVARMEHDGITALASFDRGFDVIPSVTRVEP
jgi:uncharacterized protein